VGGDYVDDTCVPLPPNGQLVIPANGLVYIATREKFNIPYYMVARYSLQVTQVYRGLLIENGLQIDPGYHGRIYVAVHNFTDQARSLLLGERFLSVDFSRTTPLPDQTSRVTTESDLVSQAGAQELKGADGNAILLFTHDPNQLEKGRTPPDFWRKYRDERHKSSLLGMEERNKALHEKTRRRVRRIQYISIGAAFAFILTLVAVVFPWISGLFLETDRTVRTIEQKVEVLEKQKQPAQDLTRMEDRIEKLEKEVQELRSSGPERRKSPPDRAKP